MFYTLGGMNQGQSTDQRGNDIQSLVSMLSNMGGMNYGNLPRLTYESDLHSIDFGVDKKSKQYKNYMMQKTQQEKIADLLGNLLRNQGQAPEQPQAEIPRADMSNLAPDVQSLPGAARAWSGSPMSYTMYGGR
jgi:hypothetical protein